LLVALALRQAVTPLVQAGLPADLPVPAATRRLLHDGYLAATLHQRMVVEPALQRTLAALQGAGLDPVLLKGAALAWTVYPEPSLRTFADLDLLLPVDQVARAAAILIGHGFWSKGGGSPGHHHLPPLFTERGHAAVELHHRLLPAPNPYRIDSRQLLARARRREVAGCQALVLGPEDALHHACLHLAWADHYGRYPLRGLVDLLAITTCSDPGLDWDLFVPTVRRARTAGAVYWPLRLSRQWLGAPIPGSVLSSLAPPRPLRALLAAIAEADFVLDDATRSDPGENVLYGLLVQLSLLTGCTPTDQLRTLLPTLFPPRSVLTHLGPDVTRSRLRHLAHWFGPWRAWPVLLAAWRLVHSRRASIWRSRCR
jgi:hypothetical protein